MTDRIVRALLPEHDLIVVACVATEAAKDARERHGLASSSAALLGEALTATLMLAALQKSDQHRVNLQIGCDGPARALFVDAGQDGDVRGYVRGKTVRYPAAERFSTGPMLGRTGYLAVLREVDGEFYRGQVGLAEGDLTAALEHYFVQSEQTPTALRLEAFGDGADQLGWIGGVLVQKLPDGDERKLEELRRRLADGAIERAWRDGKRTPHQLLQEVVGESDLLADHAVAFRCTCSKERVLRALGTLSNVEVAEMLFEDKGAKAGCDFCAVTYEITEDELRGVLEQIDLRDAEREKDAAKA